MGRVGADMKGRTLEGGALARLCLTWREVRGRRRWDKRTRTQKQNLYGLLAAVVGLLRLSNLVVNLLGHACSVLELAEAESAFVGSLVYRRLKSLCERVIGVCG